jgi:hypothetical protein
MKKNILYVYTLYPLHNVFFLMLCVYSQWALLPVRVLMRQLSKAYMETWMHSLPYLFKSDTCVWRATASWNCSVNEVLYSWMTADGAGFINLE